MKTRWEQNSLKVLENSKTTSEERLEQLRELTQMQNIAMDENSNRIHSSKERLNSIIAYERISTSLEMQSTSNAVITQNVMLKCSRKHQRKPFDEGHGCDSQGAVQVYHVV